MLMKGSSPPVISIIGGGWSFRGVDQTKIPGLTIGVNDACIHMDTDVALSMDRLWTEWRWFELSKKTRLTWLRASAVQNQQRPFPGWVHIFTNDHRTGVFSDQKGTFNGSNSGMCAFNLAWQLRPKRIILFGFDHCRSPAGEAYWFPSYPWTRGEGATKPSKYREWAAMYGEAKIQCDKREIEVINASPASAINDFPKMSPEEACALCPN
jgi:hypothetical protein